MACKVVTESAELIVGTDVVQLIVVQLIPPTTNLSLTVYMSLVKRINSKLPKNIESHESPQQCFADHANIE